MKKIILTQLLLLFLFELSAQSYIVNKDKSTVQWKAFKIGGSHEGKINISSCQLVFKEGTIQSASVTMDMESIVITDIKSSSSREKLMDVFHSPSFFNVKQFPESSLTLQSMNSNTFTGILKIKDITKAVSFPIKTSFVDNHLIVKGKILINRQDFEIEYDEGLFSTLGDKIIKDEFQLTFDLTFEKIKN